MLFNNNPVDNFQLFSVRFNAAANKYYFPDLPNLRDVYTTGITVYPRGVLGTDDGGISTDSNYMRCYMTLVEGNEEFIQKIDIVQMNPIAVDATFSSNQGQFLIANKKIHFSKSYVEFAYGQTASAFPTCLVIGVYYSKTSISKPPMGSRSKPPMGSRSKPRMGV